MNVTSNQQAVVLFNAAQPARRELHSDGNAALKVVHDPELQKRVALLGAPSDTALVLIRADYFSRGDTNALVNDGSYNDPRAARGDEQHQTSSVIRQFISQNSNTVQTQNQVALYANIQGMSTEVVRGTYIDTFA